MLKIDNLSESRELEDREMAAVSGGFDPFAHLGMEDLMKSVPGQTTEPPFWMGYPIESKSPGDEIIVEDYNHTEITTHYDK
ncbi:MAG: hypothetical protein P8Y45_22570 [Exilibacterium sp.]